MAQLIFSAVVASLLYSIAFVSVRADNQRLVSNETLAFGHTLISQNQVFEIGFFSPGKSLNRFLGIWYKNTPDVVVWVANRNHPISASESPVLMISENASLVISSGTSIIWSANNASGVASSNPVLHLLDSGNLVLVDDTSTTTEEYLWQSFDYPTDTLIPGMEMVDDSEAGVEKYLTSWTSPDDPSPGDFVFKIENRGLALADMVVLEGARKRYRLGPWNGMHFSGYQIYPNPIFKIAFVFKQQRLVSLGEPYEISYLVRTTLHTSGMILRHTMNLRKDKWNLATVFPLDACDEYAACGPNCICRSDRPIRCECLRGFAPKFQSDWDHQDWSGGCTRTKPLNCNGGDGFRQVRGVKYPDLLRFWLNTSMSLDECKAECLKNCTCTAYANSFITNGGTGCLMWFGELIDTKQHSIADSKQNVYIRVPVSELDFNTGLEEEEEKEKKNPMGIILISIVSGVLISAFINGGVLLMARLKRRVKENNEDLELPMIEMATIVQATNNFSMENMIGVGGFGPVYKGNMPSGEEIAVKRLSRCSRQGIEEFRSEVMMIAKLQHRNLIRVLGCGIEEEERMLIYEYLQNKSLDYFVFDHTRRTLLTWPKRYDIIMGIARGLLYLHHDSRLKIIHRDLKTSNILLDGNLTPKISDFELARIFQEDQSLAKTKRVVGTYGYMAPEYLMDGKYSEKSDIFSLGVVLLEIISGKRNRGYEHSDHYHNLLGHAWLLWQENRIVELMDECLYDTFAECEVKRCMQVGLLCVQKFAEDRPVMSSVVSMLGSDGAVLPEPKEPGFFMERSCGTSPYIESENDTITITDLEAR
ncbi:G-type lectin S-receptor-like serine/threonine-protein kinase At4g27290 isoform X2 [Salvia hispanica]|uniref:G-type lectin S-receptor-like serine/threonine-protein kinase At4g27290 isoform X2 n=1 Tax=Salvia hispanica TaxID=49212 RepID=UPI0020094FC8|nr:G-type lectin S-receptor-like serine/threonine-protein kinase At4g27290 isoform X2 [Salvia hispanica]